MVNKTSQIVATCPRCGALAYLPPVMSTMTTVRCPHCQHQYCLAEILPEDMQTLNVVTATPESTPPAEEPVIVPPVFSKLQVSPILRKGARRRGSQAAEDVVGALSDLAESTGNSSSSELTWSGAEQTWDGELKPGSESISSKTAARSFGGDSSRGRRSAQSSSKSSRSRRHRSRESSRNSFSGFSDSNRSAVEIVKMILGGLMALPVAQIVIWWGLGQDPLKLGPTVGAKMPALVPPALRESAQPKVPVTAGEDSTSSQSTEVEGSSR